VLYLVGRLERLFQTKRFVAEFDYQIVTPQFTSQTGRFAIHSGAERSQYKRRALRITDSADTVSI